MSFGGKGRRERRDGAQFGSQGDTREGAPTGAFDEAGFYTNIVWKRLIAHLLDAVILLVLAVPLVLFLVFTTVISFGLLAFPLTLAFLAARVIYYAGYTGGRHSATPGMRALGIEVRYADGGRPDHGRAFLRVALYYASIGLLTPLVLLAALFNGQRRTLHDLLSDTLVVNRALR
ncbi:MAG: RDD family protein [Alphaproteobacteria bacterium]